MIFMAVYTTWRHQTHNVNGFAFVDSFVNGFSQCRIVFKLTVVDSFSDFGEILIHHATCTQVHVTHFRVTHLSVR